MDYSTIIVALLALAGTVFGSWVTGNKTTAVIQEQIKELKDRVEKHNNLVERTYKLESDIQTAFIRVDELKNDVNELKKK